ncbi:hypothetical protein JCM1840_000010 [Sporobolomyces johnsonii]
MHQQDPSAVNAQGAPIYAGTTHHPDVRFASDGLPKIGPSPPPPDPPAPFKLAVAEASFSNGAVLKTDQVTGSSIELDVQPERVVLLHFDNAASAAPKRIFAGPAKKLQGIMIKIDRWPGRIGCVMHLILVFPDMTVATLTIDTHASSGFEPHAVEQIKNRCRAWSLRYKMRVSIPDIYASAFPPPGSFASLPPPPPPGYDPADSSTWLEPFPPVSEVIKNYAAAEEAKKKAAAELPRAEEYITKETSDEDMPAPKRARKSSCKGKEKKQDQAKEKALPNGVMGVDQPIYSITGREKRRSTLHTASYADPSEDQGFSEREVDEKLSSASPVPVFKHAPLHAQPRPRNSLTPKAGGAAASALPKKRPRARSPSPELSAHPEAHPSTSTPAASPPTLVALQRTLESLQSGFSGLSTQLEALTSAVSSLHPRAPALSTSVPRAPHEQQRPPAHDLVGGVEHASKAHSGVVSAHVANLGDRLAAAAAAARHPSSSAQARAQQPSANPTGAHDEPERELEPRCCCCCAATQLAADLVGQLGVERERDRARIEELEVARKADRERIRELEERVRERERGSVVAEQEQEHEKEQEKEQQGREGPA